MKTLYLLRHAKSDWSSGRPDHERPLNRRGEEAAPRMGRFLAAIDQPPHRVLSSTATRAAETARRAADAGGFEAEIETTERFYLTGEDEVIDEVRRCDDAVERLLIVGHEPTWSGVIGLLAGVAEVRFPTAALARIDLAVDRWRDTTDGSGRLVFLVTPKLLGRAGFS